MNELTAELKHLSIGYTPSPEVVKQLSGITMVSLIGPTAVGKTSCMNAVIAREGNFGRVQSFTTRPRQSRDKEGDFRFLEHDEETLTALLAEARNGRIVQYIVHSETGYVYGSELIDYSSPYAMLETLYTGVAPLRTLYSRLFEITIVTSPEEWTQRFSAQTRDNLPSDTLKRLFEGRESLLWSLDQEDMVWIYNAEGQLGTTAKEIVDIVKGGTEPNKSNRTMGMLLLNAVQIEIGNRDPLTE